MTDHHLSAESYSQWQIKTLTFAGALPFLIALLLTLFPLQGFDGAYLATSYATLIISFLCGSLWMIALKSQGASLSSLFFISNLITLIAWGAFLFLTTRWTLTLQGLCFLYLLFLDRRLAKIGLLSQWYYSSRRLITWIVVILMVLLIGALTF